MSMTMQPCLSGIQRKLKLILRYEMIALKLIAQALEFHIADHVPKTCYHLKGHGGLKKAVQPTQKTLSKHSMMKYLT